MKARQDNVNLNRPFSASFVVGRVSEYVFVSKQAKRAGVRTSKGSGKFMRWTAFTSIFMGFGFAALSAAGHIATGNVRAATPEKQTIWRASLTPALGSGGGASQTAQYLFDRSTTFRSQQPAQLAEKREPAADNPFDKVVKQAALSPDKLRKAFKTQAQVAAPSVKAERKIAYAAPSVERFGVATDAHEQAPAIALAYAAPDENPAAQALHSLADEEARTAEDMANSPEHAATPDSVPIPMRRPLASRAVAEEPEDDDIRVIKPKDRSSREPSVVEQAETPPPGLHDKKRKRIAVAAKDEPAAEKLSGGLGWSFRGMFGGGARAGKGVAVYDISAAKVYMPDGTVLAAASGIGKMANNPKYAHVKMNGPTPPHTYNLKMRERRFHGVEAIRMLPADGKNKYGRDGFLAHTQLLRGRPGQSHGCVAFADYNKFLKAFKQGKVKQMVVVSSGGRAAATRLASN